MSEKEIMEKLERIEKTVSEIAELEKQQMQEEKKIESEEETELGELKEATQKIQFPNIEDWRKYVWEGCKYKKEVKESDEIEFFCDKRKGPCRFQGCPENYVSEE